MINIQLIQQNLPYLLQGAWISIQIAFFSCSIGISLGTLLGLAQASKNKILSFLITPYVTVIRGTPMLIQIMVAYFVLPQLGIKLPDFWAAIVAIGLNSSAYISQIIRSGIASVSKGQQEAAKVLGLSRFQVVRYIVLPQAIRVVFPALSNEFITLVKDSSLASIIGVAELTRQGYFIRSRTYDALTVYAAVAVIYLLLTTTLSLLLAILERRMSRHVNN